jgi:hypothetical protein
LESFREGEGEGKGNTHKARKRKGQEKSGFYDWSTFGIRSDVSTFWSGRFRDTLSFGPKLLNTGNKTYPEPVLIPTSWSIRWGIIVMVLTLGLTVSK